MAVSKNRETLRRVVFPYGMERNSETGKWVLFNRNYKPLGSKSTDFFDWNDEEFQLDIKGLGPATLRKLDVHTHGGHDRIYFYNDSCPPETSLSAMKSYLDKMAILIKLSE